MAVKGLVVELSRNCNLSCIMCGFGGNDINPDWNMSLELFERILDEFSSGLEVIRLNGRGESAVNPLFIDLLDLTRRQCPDSAIHLFSNLSWSQPKLLNKFIDYGVQLFVSVDSPYPALMTEIRQGCKPELIEQNLEMLRSLEHRPFLVATLQEKNLNQVVELAEYAAEHRCHLLFNTVRYDDGAQELKAMIQENLQKLISDFEQAVIILGKAGLRCHCPDQMHGINLGSTETGATTGNGGRCPALSDELFITYSGKVQPCNMFHPYILGDLTRQTVEQMQSGPRWSWFVENHFESDYCSNCAYLRAEV